MVISHSQTGVRMGHSITDGRSIRGVWDSDRFPVGVAAAGARRADLFIRGFRPEQRDDNEASKPSRTPPGTESWHPLFSVMVDQGFRCSAI